MSPLDLMQKHLDADVKDNTKSPRTREIYIDIARRLFAGTLTQETIHSKSRFHQVAAVIDYLKTIDAIPEAETFGLKLRFLKNRFRKKMTAGNQIERIKQKVLTDEQFDELLSAIPDTPCGDELRRACQIARHSGLRRNEVLSLTPQAIKRLPDGISLHVHGKGRKDRRASLPLSMAYLFDGFTGFTISAGYVNMGMRRAMKKAGLFSSFHGLRHTYATEQALFGANAYELAAEMGHSDINTTLIYTHVPDAIPQSKLAFMKPDINQKICAYIRAHLDGTPLNKAARLIGVPQSNLYRIVKQGENPDVSVSTAWKYAVYFGKTLPEFLQELETASEKK